ncbi:MAG: plastocyanin/azurin family copper-binding protein, partial [Acidimicrobiia bacterium]|nr:plastocyanin/azurin family copper-binding protein [Acidimicrobiia bacterium]
MTTTRRALTALTATALIVAASIAFPGGAVADPGDEFTVSMQLLQFEPADVSVTTGTTVIFKNDEVFDYTVIRGAHQIVADDGSFDTGVIPAGGAWSMEVLEPTSTTFTCVIHPALMTGSLEVTGEPIVPDDLTKTVKIVEPDPNDSNSWTFKPADIEIAAGTTVTWRNEGAIVHTVTAEDGTFDSGNLAPGESFTFTFDDEIALNYFCEPHPWMTGTVAVGGVTPPPPPSGGGSGGGGSQGPIEIPQPTASGDGPTTYNAEIREPDIGNPQSWTFLPPELTVREGDS